MLVSAIRTIKIGRIETDTSSLIGSSGTMEIDNHADTTVLGRECLPFHDYEQPVDVVGYNPKLGSQQCPTISGAVAYDHPVTGQIYILEYHQVVHHKALRNHLMCPMQSRVVGVKINELPKFLADKPDNETHAVVMNDPLDPQEPLIIPLQLKGVTSYFPIRKPTVGEFEDPDLPHISMTATGPNWEPSEASYADQEAAMTDFGGNIITRETMARGRRIINSVSATTCADIDAIDFTDDDNFADALQANVHVSRVGTSKKRHAVDSEMLAKRWNIDPKTAARTVKSTTQRGIRTVLHPSLSRRFRTNDRGLRYNRLRHPVFTDTLKAGTISRRGNQYAQIYTTGFHWNRVHPMKLKSDAHKTVSLLFQRDGVPPDMIMDGSKEQTLGRFRDKCQEADCRIKQTEPYSPWQNAAESAIRECEKGAGRKMIRAGAPKRLWDDALEYEGYIRANTAHDLYVLDGQVPETIMSGQTSDISQFCELGFYEWIMFRDEPVQFPDDNPVLGRYLGPAIDVGPAMTAKIMKSNGEVVYRSTYRPLTDVERVNLAHIARRKEFDESITERYGPDASPDDFPDMNLQDTPNWDLYDDGIDDMPAAPDQEDAPMFVPSVHPTGLDKQVPTPEANDNLVNTSIMLPRGDKESRGRVVSRKRDADGQPIGRANTNPILDTREYLIEFDDGEVTELTANVIAQSMFASCDDDGNEYLLMDSIVDHQKNDKALTHSDQKVTFRGRSSLRRSTVGWKLCVQWKDGSTSWQSLADMKESHPLEVAEYAVAQSIEHEPGFNFWVNQVLKKRERIISLVKKRSARYLKKTHKFGIELPKTVAEAYALDKKNGNTYWADAIEKEMRNVRIAFKTLENGEHVPIGYQRINCHMIFDVKMEDFRRKARLVAGGHTTKVPACITYASVVSRETVRIALTLAALNDLEVKVADIQNAYITAPCAEKIWTILGKEFGADAGKRALIVRSLYGLRSSGAAFRNHLADCMQHLGFKPCLADPDLWMKPEVRPDDGTEYYAYVLLYVDDALVVHHDGESVLKRLDKYFKLKEGSVGDPEVYLGAKLKKMRLENGVWAWANSPAKYVRECCNNTQTYLNELEGDRWKLPKKAANPFEMGYEPELDETPVLEPSLASWYQSLIGMLRWMVELGRVDIITEVSLMASCMAMPREGHLDMVLHMFAHLRDRYNSRMAFDPSYPDIDMNDFKECDWKQFYGDVKEAIPSNAPEPRGKFVWLRMFVDSDHAGEKRTRRSRSGFFIYLNMAMIQWHSKRQPTLESSVFGAEFVALKNGIETLRGIRYKLRMMGVDIDGPSYVYGDNMSVIYNTSKPESVLKKKSNSICYHTVREAVAMGEALTAHIRSENNPADLATKVLYGGKRRHLAGELLYDLYDDF